MLNNTSVYQEQEQIARAWLDFVGRGVVPDNIRPIIAESWIRCKENGLNGWNSPYLEMRNTLEELNKRLKKRKWMLDACTTIMQYLSSIVDEVCFKLKDTDGYVLYVQDSIDSSKLYLHGIGLILNEAKQGTIASALAVKHKTYVDTNGFEHFFVCYHKFFRSAFPIWSREGELGGVLELFANYYSNNTEIARNCLKRSAAIIEKCIQNEYCVFETAKEFYEILDIAEGYICCISYDGKILNINQKLMKRWGIAERCDVIGVSIDTFLNLKNLNMLKMYPKSVRIMNVFDNITNKVTKISISTIYRPRETEVYLIRFREAALTIQDKPWAAFEKITVLDEGSNYNTYGMIGISPAMRSIREMIGKIAPTPATVLLEGPTGTGKELIARAIHERSGVNGDFITVNCGAIPANLLQSELFGYVPGAFTGADKKGRLGKLEAASNGTIFLDEIGEMPLDMQVSLLHFLQDYQVTRLGATISTKINTRVIAATNRNLEQEVHNKNFRQDLYYRLNVVKIDLPALVNRKEDIILIAQYYLEIIAAEYGSNLNGFDQESTYLLCAYSWPGNIRELKNVIERIVLFAEKEVTYVTKDLLPEELLREVAAETIIGSISEAKGAKNNVGNNIELQETQLILTTLKQCNGNLTHAAQILGIHRTTLYRKMKKIEKNR